MLSGLWNGFETLWNLLSLSIKLSQLYCQFTSFSSQPLVASNVLGSTVPTPGFNPLSPVITPITSSLIASIRSFSLVLAYSNQLEAVLLLPVELGRLQLALADDLLLQLGLRPPPS